MSLVRAAMAVRGAMATRADGYGVAHASWVALERHELSHSLLPQGRGAVEHLPRSCLRSVVIESLDARSC